jgi:anthranilate synthase component I
MFEQLTFEEFCRLATRSARVVVHRRLAVDRLTPVTAYEALSATQEACLLESAMGDRHSFIGIQGRLSMEARGAKIRLQEGSVVTEQQGDPIALLRQLHQGKCAAAADGLPPMVGGAIGFFSYDAVRYFERLPDRHPREEDFPDLSFTFFDGVAAFDHQRSLLTLCATVEVQESPLKAYRDGIERLNELQRQLEACVRLESGTFGEKGIALSSDLDDAAFAAMVATAKEAIAAGELFQVVLSRCFECPITARPFDIYRALRLANPSPFMFFFQRGSYAFAGASPERLVSLRGDRLETLPLAGTRPRGTPAETAQLAQELLADPKELAEHLMLVDLGRNDLGKISCPGSVEVDSLTEIVAHGAVIHLQSRVVSRIAPGYDALDALKAALPAGTLSGAPKVRAMELIDELESSRRGLYGGAVGYWSANGDADFCIAIRMARLHRGRAFMRVGAGIVADSDPDREAKETRVKIAGVLKAVALAEGGLP